MAEIRPFRGIVYDRAVAGPLQDLVCPPYDVINEDEQTRLYEVSEHNVVRLELNRDENRYESAAVTFRSWLESGVLTREPEPALYAYAQRFEALGREVERWGFFARLALEPFESGVVRPHERTHGAAKADRLALLRACRANLSPIFGLYSAPGFSFEDTVREAIEGRDGERIDLGDGIVHRFWRVDSPEIAETVRRRLADEVITIADGHHRYETALRYRDEMRRAHGDSSGEAGSDFVLAFLSNMEEPGLIVLPTHRLLRDFLPSPTDFLEAAAKHFTVEKVEGGLEGLRAALPPRRPTERRLGFVHRDLPDPFVLSIEEGTYEEALGGAPEVRRLDVAVLHGLVLEDLLRVHAHEIADAGGLVYVKDDAEVFARVASGGFEAGFIMNATRLDEVRAVCGAGELMPEKSTYFHPKLLTGLVFNSVED